MKESKNTLAEVLIKVNCLDLPRFVRNSIFSTFQGAMSSGGFSIWWVTSDKAIAFDEKGITLRPQCANLHKLGVSMLTSIRLPQCIKYNVLRL